MTGTIERCWTRGRSAPGADFPDGFPGSPVIIRGDDGRGYQASPVDLDWNDFGGFYKDSVEIGQRVVFNTHIQYPEAGVLGWAENVKKEGE